MKVIIEKRNLKEILKTQTKNKLMELTHLYPIKGKSKLKKEELINALIENMLSETIINENAIILGEEFNQIDKEAALDEEANKEYDSILKIRKICSLGYGRIIANDNKIKFIIADEIDDLFVNSHYDNKEEISRYSLIKSYLLACVRLYGIYEIDFFINLFNEQNPKEIPIDYEELNIQLNRCERIGLESVRYANCIVSESLLMFEGDIEDLLKKRENKDFYIPNKEELLKYKDEFYIEKNSQYLELEKFINKKVKNKEIAEGLAEDVTYLLRFEDANIECVINEFNRRNISFESLKEIERFMKVYVDLANNTRNWCNKGNTPQELLKHELLRPLSNVDIGRNDPCKCGSGKKYKKCCLLKC